MIPLDLTKPATKLAFGLGAALLVLLLCLASAWGGYRHGHATAQDAGDAKYAKLETAHASALAEASAKALDRYVQESQRATALAADLVSAKQRLASSRALITKEIPHATTDLDACRFGPDFLRLYNQALGLGADALPAPASPGGAEGQPKTTGPTDSGLRDNTPLTTPLAVPATASAADLLTHVRDVGQWCQATASQRDALLKLLEAQ